MNTFKSKSTQTDNSLSAMPPPPLGGDMLVLCLISSTPGAQYRGRPRVRAWRWEQSSAHGPQETPRVPPSRKGGEQVWASRRALYKKGRIFPALMIFMSFFFNVQVTVNLSKNLRNTEKSLRWVFSFYLSTSFDGPWRSAVDKAVYLKPNILQGRSVNKGIEVQTL